MVLFTSLNCKGLNSFTKHMLTLKELKNQKVDIALLQELHFVKSKPHKLYSNQYPIGYYASADKKRMGVAIVVH